MYRRSPTCWPSSHTARSVRVHVCMCACVYECMCACVHVCMCACVHACVHVRMCACVHLLVLLVRCEHIAGPLERSSDHSLCMCACVHVYPSHFTLHTSHMHMRMHMQVRTSQDHSSGRPTTHCLRQLPTCGGSVGGLRDGPWAGREDSWPTNPPYPDLTLPPGTRSPNLDGQVGRTLGPRTPPTLI